MREWPLKHTCLNILIFTMAAAFAKLGILLPLTSRGSSSAGAVVDAVKTNLLASLQPKQRCEIFIGVDFDDDSLLAELEQLQQRCRQRGVVESVAVFPAAELQPARQRAAQHAQQQPAETPLYDSSLKGDVGTESSAESPAERAPAAPICWMWERLAVQAAAAGCSCFVLLGDDTMVQPAGSWVDLVLGAQSDLLSVLLMILAGMVTMHNVT